MRLDYCPPSRPPSRPLKIYSEPSSGIGHSKEARKQVEEQVHSKQNHQHKSGPQPWSSTEHKMAGMESPESTAPEV